MFRAEHPRRKPDILLLLCSLVGMALLATLTVHFNVLDHGKTADQAQHSINQRL